MRFFNVCMTLKYLMKSLPYSTDLQQFVYLKRKEKTTFKYVL